MSVMFEKIGQAAEKAATGVSRRGFLGRLGKAALGAAGGLAAILAFPRDAAARRCPQGRILVDVQAEHRSAVRMVQNAFEASVDSFAARDRKRARRRIKRPGCSAAAGLHA